MVIVAMKLKVSGHLLQLTLEGIGVNGLRVNSAQCDVGEGPATLRRGGGRRRNGCRASCGTIVGWQSGGVVGRVRYRVLDGGMIEPGLLVE